ncbi:hypothetical protein [Burkholderia pseudomallei]|uniref:hypothetical protein n=1 Tax=Burkholderia pseudomallei TaxID=28450 RepID=UPI00016B1AAC|nr:hypothetical protein [Burkholderia pseudomallei]MCV9985104.1 hypothetical protein [Burkholderia pseudomallei]MCV9988117.1 hypothetical protein [Burkholderia pseudomallei]MCW0147770.1 hypothetical protein [Burkholderia pseudomallei]CAJ7221274.1 Uncharacterised protein [Burkholderia pseudomallei]CAJ7241099.1 Uncharacterised protein [Burkholderia pseudomallei]
MRRAGEFDKVVAAATRGPTVAARNIALFPGRQTAAQRAGARSRDVGAADSDIPIRMPNLPARRMSCDNRRIRPHPPSISDASSTLGDSVAERLFEFDKFTRAFWCNARTNWNWCIG